MSPLETAALWLACIAAPYALMKLSDGFYAQKERMRRKRVVRERMAEFRNRILGPYIPDDEVCALLRHGPREMVWDSLWMQFVMPDNTRVNLELAKDQPQRVHKDFWMHNDYDPPEKPRTHYPQPVEHIGYMKMGAGLSATPAVPPTRRMNFRGHKNEEA